MAKRKPASTPIKASDGAGSSLEMTLEQLDLHRQALENEKLEEEIKQIKKGTSNIWRTPTALIAILTLTGTCFAFIYREISTYTTTYKTIAENENLKKTKKELQDEKNNLYIEIQAIRSSRDDSNKELTALQDRETQLRKRMEAEQIVEKHGEPIRRYQDRDNNEAVEIVLTDFESRELLEAVALLLSTEPVRQMEVTLGNAAEEIRSLVAILRDHRVDDLVLDGAMTDADVLVLTELKSLKSLSINIVEQQGGDSEFSVALFNGRPHSLQQESVRARQQQQIRYTHQAFRQLGEQLPQCAIRYGPPDFAYALERAGAFKQPTSGEKLDELVLKVLEEVAVVKVMSDPIMDTVTVRLDLTVTQVGDENLAWLEYVPNLTSLEVSGDDISDIGMEHIGKLTELEVLRVRDMRGTPRLTDLALAYISKLTKLRQLVVSGSITAAGVAQLKSIQGLEHLSLRSSFISEQGLQSLSSNNRQLRTLVLGDVLITDKAVEWLAALPELEFLQVWSTEFVENPVDETQVMAIREKLPKCKVYGRREWPPSPSVFDQPL